MTSRVRELEARRKLLLAESAIQRSELSLDAAVIGNALQSIDRVVGMVQRLRRRPLVVGAVVVGLLVLRRHPVGIWLTRGVAFAGAAHRIAGTLRALAAEQPGEAPPRQ